MRARKRLRERGKRRERWREEIRERVILIVQIIKHLKNVIIWTLLYAYTKRA